MGEVYEVEDTLLRGDPVALKTIRSEFAGDANSLHRFKQEVLLARKLSHPHLCPIYDVARCEEPSPPFLFFTLKLLRGETLSARLARAGRITGAEAEALMRGMTSGVSALHAAHVIHRDLKPNNVMLDGAGAALCVTIMDFGLARLHDAESTLSPFSIAAGTPGYMAPEVLNGQGPSQAADLYALGVLLHEALTGERPAAKPMSLLLQPSPALAAAEVSPALRNAVGELFAAEPDRRCAAFEHLRRTFDLPSATLAPPGEEVRRAGQNLLTRRGFAVGAGVATLAAAGAVWLRWPEVEQLLDPLPDRRSIALLSWPVSSAPGVVLTVLDSIAQRLARVEAYVKDLAIISLRDLPAGTGAGSGPTESAGVLGANLVLAVSFAAAINNARLNLQVLDASTGRVLRQAHVSSLVGEMGSLGERASAMAARLLSLPLREGRVSDEDELKRVSPPVFRLYSEAGQLGSRPNGTGFEPAVAKYQQVLEADPRFSLGYARLALLYIEQYLVDSDKAKLSLAERNASLALRYNPGSAKGLLSQALVCLYSGRTEHSLEYFAKSLKADPGNPETLLYRAQALRDVGSLGQAQQVYEALMRERPNFWPAYNELGWVLSRQAKYQEAAETYKQAALLAPEAALPLANLGSMYLEQGRRQEAVEASKQSLRRHPNEGAYLTLGDIAWTDGDYKGALGIYRSAAAVNSENHLIWRNIGDCDAALGDAAGMRASYARAAQMLAGEVARNPGNGMAWATLAFYHAKIGATKDAEADMAHAMQRGATDAESQFMMVQALAVLGRSAEALRLLLTCMDKGLSPVEVNLAPDLAELRKTPEYRAKAHG